MRFYYERFYIAKDYKKIAFFILSCDQIYLPGGNENITLADEVVYNWSVAYFEKLNACVYKDSELLEILKDGLSVYGLGAKRNESFPNFIVTFNF